MAAAAKTWFHYDEFDRRTSTLRVSRICNGHTRGIEGVSPCYDLRLLREKFAKRRKRA